MAKAASKSPSLAFLFSSPLARVLNRFTKDVHFMDDLLPATLYDFTVCSFMVAGGTLIIFVANPWVVIR